MAAAPVGFVGEADHDGIFEFARGRPLLGAGKARVADIIGLRGIEDEVDRIKRYDGRKQRRAALTALDKIADVDLVIRDASGNGRAHLRPFEIELGIAQGRFGAELLGLRDVEIGLALIDVAQCDRAGFDELLRPA